MAHDPTQLPPDLPVPSDDGACLHLRTVPLPDSEFPSTGGRAVNLSTDLARPVVLFFYPRTGVPGEPPHQGFSGEDWDTIPGARGCTPQSCGFRDLHAEFTALGVDVFGISTNTSDHQREFKQRQRIPFDFLSDERLELVRALKLPTFDFPVESGGPSTLIKRMAWYVESDAKGVPRIRGVWYPVFPPDRNAADVLAWLERRRAITIRAIEPRDLGWVREELGRHWGGAQIWSVGQAFEADTLPGLIAEIGGERAGLLTYHVDGGGAQGEAITLSARIESKGVGARLLEAAEDVLRDAGCVRAYLTTSNDNTRAIGFYQSCGWRLSNLYKGFIEEARKHVPSIPATGHRGIPLRDELEFEWWL